MAFYNKIKWILGILMVFVLIVTTNLIDRNNFIRVRDSVVTIYEDRLIANDLIFEISKLVQEKEMAVILSDSTFFKEQNPNINKTIQGFISRFEQTKLTPEENQAFEDLKRNLQALIDSENDLLNSNFETKTEVLMHISSITGDLSRLSKIQLSEGSRQMSISKRAIDTVELFTQIEIYLLVFLAIVVQIIIMYNPKQSKKD